jgi:inner membrane protein
MNFAERMRNSVFVKMLFIGVVSLILLIPLFMIRKVIGERELRRDQAVAEISGKWGGVQTIAGPVLTIPYVSRYKDDKGEVRSRKDYLQVLPQTLSVTAAIDPQVRSRGIYEAVLYTAELTVGGEFPAVAVEDENINEKDILWNESYLLVGVTDTRGITEAPRMDWNGQRRFFEPGVPHADLFTSGIHLKLPDIRSSAQKPQSFDYTLRLNGSDGVYFVPTGRTSSVTLTSSWKDPSFTGAYLPDSRSVTGNGFQAHWRVSHLSRNYPQRWKSEDVDFGLLRETVSGSSFGVRLFLSVDHYHKSTRAIKYAVLFIVLTFAAFFLFEIINRLRIHPFQYLLIGFAMSLFYLLLLSLSEHVGFLAAYAAASLVTIGLIIGYSSHLLADKKRSVFFAGLLALLYGCLYILLQLEDFALLVGVLVLLVVLGVLMFITRKIDWYSVRLKGNGV